MSTQLSYSTSKSLDLLNKDVLKNWKKSTDKLGGFRTKMTDLMKITDRKMKKETMGEWTVHKAPEAGWKMSESTNADPPSMDWSDKHYERFLRATCLMRIEVIHELHDRLRQLKKENKEIKEKRDNIVQDTNKYISLLLKDLEKLDGKIKKERKRCEEKKEKLRKIEREEQQEREKKEKEREEWHDRIQSQWEKTKEERNSILEFRDHPQKYYDRIEELKKSVKEEERGHSSLLHKMKESYEKQKKEIEVSVLKVMDEITNELSHEHSSFLESYVSRLYNQNKRYEKELSILLYQKQLLDEEIAVLKKTMPRGIHLIKDIRRKVLEKDILPCIPLLEEEK